MASVGTVVKRVLLGRQVSSAHLEHTLLPKVLALPVFSSDPLSSVAYATEEMMLVLVTAGAAALSLMLPLAGVIVLILAIVVTSYRQTVRAYPRGGGSYIVARENLGTIPGLVAAAAIQIGYVVTAAVSVTAGAVAVTSAAPSLAEHRLLVAMIFILVIALANLRGVRESGTLFAVPTYGFVVWVYVTILAGFVQCLDGCPRADTADIPLEVHAGLGIFLVLRAATQGASALTGVEAIADGVQAFRRPQGRNAAATLAVLGFMSATLFLGVTALARLLEVRVGEALESSSSVLSQIGETVFGRGLMFFALQTFTALILIVAANTAYQDFPRLSAILAGDRFMPGQFKNRGDRLVFSNGVVVLSGLAALLVWIYDAQLSKLIPLYLVGVFTAFTLSQAGMVRRWVKVKEGRWRRNAAINAVGAATTGTVLLVAVITRFTQGAWMVIVAVPIIVTGFLMVSRHYERVRRDLTANRVRFGETGQNHILFVLSEFDPATAEALGYVRSLRPAGFDAVYVGSGSREDAEARWRDLAGDASSLSFVPPGRDPVDVVIERTRMVERGPDDFVTVIIPEFFPRRSLVSAVVKRVTFRLKIRLLTQPGVVITDVPVLAEEGRLVGVDGRGLIPERVVGLVFVSAAHDAAVRAINYAESINAHDIRAVFLATEPEEVPAMLEGWAERGISVPLDVVEAPFRDLGPPLLEEVRRVTAEPGTVAAVILPEFLVTRWWHRLLHNNRALFIKRVLLFEPRVILSSVPFQLGGSDGSR
ncbi:MAG TPA: APC family permease [Actinomycetota bacterium]|nr:APC family permease [Actinomycetota bacterium]